MRRTTPVQPSEPPDDTFDWLAHLRHLYATDPEHADAVARAWESGNYVAR